MSKSAEDLPVEGARSPAAPPALALAPALALEAWPLREPSLGYEDEEGDTAFLSRDRVDMDHRLGAR